VVFRSCTTALLFLDLSFQKLHQIEDEHGNIFRPLFIGGWAWLPSNAPAEGWEGDFPTRINPGALYENRAYYEPIPKTSRQLEFKVPLGKRTLIFLP
jgi:hypothetical protein